MKKHYPMAAALAAMTALIATPALSADITLVSDGSTLAVAVQEGDARLTSGDTTGLTFGSDSVGADGTFTSPPAGAPVGTEVINISPTQGESGFFLVEFTLPTVFSGASITGAANADDNGVVFLNGNALANIDEFDGVTFSSTDQSIFHSGTNYFLVSDNNSGGGPSGAAFYADITYSPTAGAVPEPSTWALMLVGFGLVGAALRRRARAVISATCA